MWIINKVNLLLNFVLPEECLGCGRSGDYLCPECASKIPPPETISHNTLTAASYKNKLAKEAIHALKYKKARKIARPLAKLTADRLDLKRNYQGPNIIIIPIPLSKKRKRQRGFNQAEEIANSLSDIINIDVVSDVLYKNRDTISQVEIKDRKKRLNNLKDAFSVKNKHLIKNKTILLIDDVSTTGATIKEASVVLKCGGAKKVIGIAVAR